MKMKAFLFRYGVALLVAAFWGYLVDLKQGDVSGFLPGPLIAPLLAIVLEADIVQRTSKVYEWMLEPLRSVSARGV
jgi:hypothetical protein